MNDNIDYRTAWNRIKTVFPILDDSYQLEDKPFSKNDFNEVIHFINTTNLAVHIQNLMVSQIEKKFRDVIVPEFWSYFTNSNGATKGFQQFYNAVKYLYDNYRQLDYDMQRLKMFKQATQLDDPIYNETCLESALKLILKATMLSQLNLEYQSVVLNFYECALKMEDIEENNDGKCTVCYQENIQCNCIYLFQETNR